jgi:hypothetical protein
MVCTRRNIPSTTEVAASTRYYVRVPMPVMTSAHDSLVRSRHLSQ